MKTTHHCGATWAGSNTCHCSACHETFVSVTAFDKHRKQGKCAPPQDVGLVQNGRSYRCWGYPVSLHRQDSDGLLGGA